jgi:hypothetical protein
LPQFFLDLLREQWLVMRAAYECFGESALDAVERFNSNGCGVQRSQPLERSLHVLDERFTNRNEYPTDGGAAPGIQERPGHEAGHDRAAQPDWRAQPATDGRLIQVELMSETDGFLIFETLNTRGADLRLADLVRRRRRGGACAGIARWW